MSEFWETAFIEKQLMWGVEPTRSALLASDFFAKRGVQSVLIPGVGYGRNARPFLERGCSVTGIEISETALALARSQLGLDFPIHHGSVTSMPYDSQQYDGVFCFGLIHLLDAEQRAKLIRDCSNQLSPGGHMIFTAIAKQAPMYGRGVQIGHDWFEILPGVKMYFYDAASVQREFGPHGLLDLSEVDEPAHGSSTLPFLYIVCRKS